MLNKTVTKYLRRATESSYFWGIAGFYIHSKENRLIVSNSVWRKLSATFRCFAHTSYSVCLLVRIVQLSYLNTEQADGQPELLLEFTYLVYLIPPFSCQFFCFGREETFAAFVNQYLAYYRKTEGSYVVK